MNKNETQMDIGSEIQLQVPVAPADLETLRIGQIVYLDGVIYTGREALYRRAIDEKQPLPVDPATISNVNFHCSPAAAVDSEGRCKVGAVTATASFRFQHYLREWLPMSKAKIIIGKGGMPPAVYRDIFVPNGAVYLTTVGYGTGALLGRGIHAVRDVHLLEEFGIAQAMWIFEVKRFGPFIVESDLQGNSLFEAQNEAINRNIEQLYAGSRPPALHRYGETDRRDEELIL
ncbi:MAG: fumarate hydratase C-terminal domain-containing protein [Verrucomicrobiota bacterium]